MFSIPTEVSLFLLVLHFVADFILQSDWMAQNKSKNNWALLSHAIVYTSPFALFYGLKFALITFLFHFWQDYFTSRINSKLWKAGKVHYFFVGVGADQLLHFYTLAWTLQIVTRYYA